MSIMRAFTAILRVFVISVFLQHDVNAQLNDSKFRGAVVEYGAKYLNTSSKDTVILNVNNYRSIVDRLMQLIYPPDIIVFPECGLSSIKWLLEKKENIYGEEIPNPFSERIIPCESGNAEALKQLSCTAKKFSVYIVVNLIEKVLINDTQTLLYNTNVAFNRKGALIARYRKFNIYGVDGKPISKPKTADFSYFDTDFGVRVGTFTCFDILFKTPALDLVRYYGATHIAFPTAWFSEQPFLTAIQEQAAWAYGSNAILLASGYNDPEKGNTGSGIYFRNGDRETFGERSMQVQVKQDFAIVSWIPKSVTENRTQRFPTDTLVVYFNPSIERAPMNLKTDYLNVYTTKTIEPPSKPQFETEPYDHTVEKVIAVNENICNRDLCCEFHFVKKTRYCLDEPEPKYSFQGDDFGLYKYRLAVFNGVRSYGGVTTAGVQICSIINCLSSDRIDLCAIRTDSLYIPPEKITLPSLYTYRQCHTSFDNITIRAKLKNNIINTFLTSNILLASQKNDLLSNQVARYGSIVNPELYKIVKINDIDNDTALYEFRCSGALDNPLSINLYNRIFDKDGSVMTSGNNSNSVLNTSIPSIVILFLYSVLLNLLIINL